MADVVNNLGAPYYKKSLHHPLKKSESTKAFLLSSGVSRLFDSFGAVITGDDPYAIAGFSPKLVFDPVADTYRTGGNASTFADLVTFTRAGNATYTDATGTLQTAAANVARRNHHVYEGGEWVNAGMLVEPTAATNLVTYSEDFTNAAWVAVAVAKTSATLLTASATNNAHGVVFSFSSTTGQAYTYQTVLTYDNHQFVSLRIFAGIFPHVCFDLVNGIVAGAEAGASGTIRNLGSGNFLCSITVTATSTGSGNVGVFFQPNATNFASAWVAAGTERVSAKNNQLEAGSVPSSYIPTTGSTATRAAETVSIAAAKLPYSATAMSIAMRGRMTYADTGVPSEVIPFSWSLDGANLIYPQVYTLTAPDRFRFLQASSGVFEIVQANPSPYSPGINVPFKIASYHTSTSINGAVDGTALTADLTPTSLPNLSATPLQLAFSGGPMIIEEFAMWDVDLADAGIAEASA